jgi:hypothetical protein
MRPDLEHSPWHLWYENVPAHTATNVRTFLARNGVAVLNHRPYFPDLAPTDFLLFPKVKPKLKSCHFDTNVDIQNNMMTELNHITKDEFSKCFQGLHEHCNRSIQFLSDHSQGND